MMVVTTGVETDRGICSDSESESALLARYGGHNGFDSGVLKLRVK